MPPSALITGITGQAGSFMAELLLSKEYIVHGIIRRSSSFNTGRINHLYTDPHHDNPKLILHYGDLTDGASLRTIITQTKPDIIFHLGAQSHVRVSFDIPEYTADTVAMGTLRLLEATREYISNTGHQTKLYHSASSEMFGSTPPPQTETTPFHPRSPYGVSKVAAYWHAINYREAYNMHICNGILFNNESERRGETFVTRKITKAASRIAHQLQDKLYLGNIESRRDWGHTKDYCNAMWLMTQQDQPDDYVIATGESHTIIEFLDEAFGYVNLDWHKYVVIDDRYKRPAEVDNLCGDSTKAHQILGWKPAITFKQLAGIMMDCDLQLAAKERLLARRSISD